jgi:hypothetical protein
VRFECHRLDGDDASLRSGRLAVRQRSYLYGYCPKILLLAAKRLPFLAKMDTTESQMIGTKVFPLIANGRRWSGSAPK